MDRPVFPYSIFNFPDIKGIDEPIWEEFNKEHYKSPIKSNGLSEYYILPEVPKNVVLRLFKRIKNFLSDSERKQIEHDAWRRIWAADKVVKIEGLPLHTALHTRYIKYIDHTLNKVVHGVFTGKEIYELYNREVKWRKEHNYPFKFFYDENREMAVFMYSKKYVTDYLNRKVVKTAEDIEWETQFIKSL